MVVRWWFVEGRCDQHVIHRCFCCFAVAADLASVLHEVWHNTLLSLAFGSMSMIIIFLLNSCLLVGDSKPLQIINIRKLSLTKGTQK